jgi:hypothetical protein
MVCHTFRGPGGSSLPLLAVEGVAGRAAACREGSSAASWDLLGNFAVLQLHIVQLVPSG